MTWNAAKVFTWSPVYRQWLERRDTHPFGVTVAPNDSVQAIRLGLERELGCRVKLEFIRG